ncbi:MAG TPA: 30S ribosomal protein S17 [Candidatus Paceibacterota bacterium]
MKKFKGIVTSDKMKDTITVSVSSYKKHPKYGKFTSIRKKFKVHDAGNTKKVGERVEIVETRPISKEKHFKVI